MTEIEEDDELGRLNASNATDRKILRTVLLINLGQSAGRQPRTFPGRSPSSSAPMASEVVKNPDDHLWAYLRSVAGWLRGDSAICWWVR